MDGCGEDEVLLVSSDPRPYLFAAPNIEVALIEDLQLIDVISCAGW
jgi:hypothetical protein